MKRKNGIATPYLLFLILCMMFCACSERRTVIGVSQCSGDLWRQKVNQEIRIGQYQYKNVDVIITSADNDADKQVRQIDSLVQQKVDLLVVAPSNIQMVAPAIERVYRSGIPVILYDRKIASSHYTAYIGGDNVGIGQEVARFLVEKMQGKGTVVEITGEKGSSPVIERHEGFMEVMHQYPQVKVVTLHGDWEVDGSKKLMSDYLEKGGRADAVFGHNDAEAEGAWKAAKEKGLDKQIMFLGIDGLPGENQGVSQVRQGHFVGSYVYPTKGEAVVALAMDILQGRKYKKENLMRSYLATAENAEVIDMQYREMEAKVKDLDNIYDSIDDYTRMYRKQQWMTGIAIVIVILLSVALLYLYRLYRRRARKQKEVVRSLVEPKDEWASDAMKLDETERYFMDRFKKKILERMGDANLNMDALGVEMQLSKVQMYRKVKALTGKSPAELLKEMRLHRAYQLLVQTDKNISEIASEVGFALPGYFSACFKRRFGISPTELREKEK